MARLYIVCVIVFKGQLNVFIHKEHSSMLCVIFPMLKCQRTIISDRKELGIWHVSVDNKPLF